MNVSLTPELEQFIASKVQSGFYHSSSEVIREGLRMLAEQDAIRNKRLEILGLEIEKGLASLKSGDIMSGDAAYQKLLHRRNSYGE